MTPETTKLLQDTIQHLWQETIQEHIRQQPTPTLLLIYQGKHGNEIYLANTPERLTAARQAIFTQLDHWGCYQFNQNDKNHLEKARAGDPQAIAHLLETHRHLEHEGWELTQATDATQP